eukprot:269059-Chlamydomonas_euryale.AAC.1
MLRAGVMPGYHPPGAPMDGEDGGEREDGDGEASTSTPPPPHRCESKLRTLLTELRRMHQADPTAKALVFSQYT